MGRIPTTTTMTKAAVVALAERSRGSVRMEGTKKGAGERVERGRRTGDSGEWSLLCARAALEREERRDESEGRKREPGDRWPFQTMRNSGDKGGARARMCEGREGERGRRRGGGGRGRGRSKGWESERKRERQEVRLLFSRKGRGGRNERWGKAEREKERKRGRKRKKETWCQKTRKGWKTGESDEEWTARAISGGD